MIQAPHSEREPYEFTGKHMLAIMVLFFGVIISVNITMAVIAKGSWTGLVVKNSYVASQEFNDHLAKAKAQKELGLHSTVSYQKGVLSIQVLDRDGLAIAPESLSVRIGRPAFEQLDQTSTLKRSAGSVYTLHMPLEAGPWALEITGVVSENPYRRDVRLFVSNDGNARVE